MTRIAAATDRLLPGGMQALLVNAPTNIRYLTGFTGSNGTVVLRESGATLITDPRYTARAHDEVGAAGAEVEIVIASGGAFASVVELLGPVDRVGIEADHIVWSEAEAFAEALGRERIVASSGLVEALREFKDAAEIELMRTAASIADGALVEMLLSFGPGMTERQVARTLDALVLDGGADGAGFETIVASGPNSARPHHQATNRVLEMGDLVIIDFGAEVGGYRSDMTRSFVLGEPNERQAEILEAVEAAQQAGVDAVSVGITAKAIDAACRDHLEHVGLASWFTHGTGHGVGLDIHEGPSVSAKGTATLAAGHVITVEPGVYLPEVGGVRWEDTVVVTTSGADPLTRCVKQPIVAC